MSRDGANNATKALPAFASDPPRQLIMPGSRSTLLSHAKLTNVVG